jgi:hypothetical protein
LTVPADTTFSLNQLTLAGACDSTTTVWVKSEFVGDVDEESHMESIESDSEDDGDLSTSTIAIGHLKWGANDSIRLNLTFGEGERVKFTVVGDGEVHFAGNLIVEQAIPEGDDEDDDDEHAVAEAGQLRLLGGVDSSDEDEEDEEYVEVDSDEGETIYLNDGMDEDVSDSDSDSEDDGDFVVNPDDLSDSDNDGLVLVEAGSDSDSDDEEMIHIDPAAYRRLLLGEGAGDRPESDSDDDLDDEALYAAMAADDDSVDGEVADEAEFVSASGKHKKRPRSGSFEEDFASPGHKRSKRQEHANGNGSDRHGYRKQGGRNGGKRNGGGRF